MIAKKNSRYNLEKKRSTYFLIGLLATGSFTLAAFTYNAPLTIEKEKQRVAHENVTYQLQHSPEEKQENKTSEMRNNNDEQQQETTTVADAAANELSQESDNSSELTDAAVGMENPPFKLGDTFYIEPDDIEEEVVEYADVEAQFIGGNVALQKYIVDHVNYPEDARIMGDQGKVYVSFVVEKDGSVSNIHVEKGVTRSLDREAKRVVRSFPKWIPGEFDARKVRTRVRLPIVFILSGE